MKSKLFWVSVGGNPCEPARVVSDGDKQIIYTIACETGTILTEENEIVLVQEISQIPLTPAQAEKSRIAWNKKLARERKLGIPHNYKEFPS